MENPITHSAVSLSSLSVIIPTLNESSHLRQCLKSVAGVAEEIIIVDGGSSDNTLSIAKKHGCQIIVTPPGRGQQLAAGAAAATKQWLLFLHADTILDDRWSQAVSQFIMVSQDQKKVAAFQYKNDLPGLSAWLLEKLVMARGQLGLVYGDQGLVIESSHYAQLGGYRELAIMEDIEFCQRIGRRNIQIINASALTSGRRYRRTGVFLRGLKNMLCLCLYFLGIPIETIRKFYGTGPS
tara:strand:+ start:947 stop:1660 length:714 start_codon:yes stop_codon:yes gene_type:complete